MKFMMMFVATLALVAAALAGAPKEKRDIIYARGGVPYAYSYSPAVAYAAPAGYPYSVYSYPSGYSRVIYY